MNCERLDSKLRPALDIRRAEPDRKISKLQLARDTPGSAIDNYIDGNRGNDGKFEIAALRSVISQNRRPVLGESARTLQFRYQIENCYFVEIKLQFVISVIIGTVRAAFCIRLPCAILKYTAVRARGPAGDGTAGSFVELFGLFSKMAELFLVVSCPRDCRIHNLETTSLKVRLQQFLTE